MDICLRRVRPHTTLPGSTLAYYANDLAYQQMSGGKRQTWQLDANLRFRSWKVETGSGSSWTTNASKVNHYAGDDDSPRWVSENTETEALTRNVSPPAADWLPPPARPAVQHSSSPTSMVTSVFSSH